MGPTTDEALATDLDLVERHTGVRRYRELVEAGRTDYGRLVRRLAASLRGEPSPDPEPLPPPPPPAPVVDRFGTCIHLGPPLAGPDGRGVVRDCRSCSGSVRLKVFACHHPAHEDTDALRCRACPDYTPGGGAGA